MRIKTFARVRGGAGLQHDSAGLGDGASSSEPTSSTTSSSSLLQTDEANGVVTLAGSGPARKPQMFAFDGVLGPERGQEEVYGGAVRPLVDGALEGINGTVFAYGQTGSGKTHTMTGGEGYEQRGAIPRALSAVFADKRLVRCAVSYVEVFNETLLDLLDGRKRISMFTKDDEKRGKDQRRASVHMKGLTVRQPRSEEEALDLFFRGNMERSTGSTALNMSSSRSHCLLTLEVETTEQLGRLHFVDLAGSERTQDATSKHINLSLHFLEQVVLNLQVQQQHVGYRNSIMTALLRESLGGNCQTAFVLTISPDAAHAAETLSTCRFARRCRSLSTNVVANESLAQRAARLEQENAGLRVANADLKGELELALSGLREHDKVRDMLRDLLAQMDADVDTLVSSEATFLNGVAVQVDVDERLVLATKGRTARAVRIPRGTVTSFRRVPTDAGTSVFTLYGKPPRNRGTSIWTRASGAASGSGASNNTASKADVTLEEGTDQYKLLELEFASDGSTVPLVAWVQAFEQWLCAEVDTNATEGGAESEEKCRDDAPARASRSSSVIQRAITVIQKRLVKS